MASHTRLASDVAIQSTKHYIALPYEVLRCASCYDELAQLLAHGQTLLPSHSILVLLARATRRGANGGKTEMGMECEEEDEALAYATCCAQDA